MVHQEITKLGKQSEELLPPLTKDEFVKIKTALDPYDFAVIDQLGMKILAIRSPTDFPDMVADLEVVAPELSLDEPETLTHALIIGNVENLGVPVDMVASLIKAKKEDDARIVGTIRDKIKHPLETFLFKDQYDQKPVLRLGIRSPMPLEELQSKEFKEVFEGVPVPNGTRVVYIIAADGYMKISAKEFLREMGEAIAPPPIMFHRALPEPEENTPKMKDVDVDLGNIIDHQFTVSDDEGEKTYTLGPPREKASIPPAAEAPLKTFVPAPSPPELESPPKMIEKPAGPPLDLVAAVDTSVQSTSYPSTKGLLEEFEKIPDEPPGAEEPVVELEAPPEIEEEFEEVMEEPPAPPEEPVVELEETPLEPEPPAEVPKEIPEPVPLTPTAPLPPEVHELTPVEVPPPPEDLHPHIVMKPIPDPILPGGTPVGPYETLETAAVKTYETLEEKMAVETPYVVNPDQPVNEEPRAPCPPPSPVPIPIPETRPEEVPEEVVEDLPVAEEAAPVCKDVFKIEAREPEEPAQLPISPTRDITPPELPAEPEVQATATEVVLEEPPALDMVMEETPENEEFVEAVPEGAPAPEEFLEETPEPPEEPVSPEPPVPQPVPIIESALIAEPAPVPPPIPVFKPTPLPPIKGPAPAVKDAAPPKPLILRRDEGGSHVEKLTERMGPEEPLSTQMGPLSEEQATSRWFTAQAPKPATRPALTKAQEIMGEGVKRARITDIRTALMATNFNIRPEGALGGFDIQATKRYRMDVVVLVSYVALPKLRDYMEFERKLRAFPDAVGIFISEGPPDKDMKINAIGKPIAMIGIDELRDIELYVRDIVL